MSIHKIDKGYGFKKNGNIVGKCLVVDKKPTMHISFFVIYEKFRGNNLSSEFYQLLEKEFFSSGFDLVTLETDEFTDNGSKKCGKLESLYKSWGFKASGPERFLYDSTGEFLMRRVPMKKSII